MPGKSEVRTGPPQDVAEKLFDIHSENGTLDKVLESGVGEEIIDAVMSQFAAFGAYTDTYGVEPWSYDGTTLSLIADINEGDGSSYPSNFAYYNGDLYVSAHTEETGYGLFKVDGETGEVSVVELTEGTGISFARQFTEFNGGLVFLALIEGVSHELFRIDGETGEVSTIDISEDPFYSPMHNLAEFNGDLYLSARTDATGWELFKVDGETGEVSVIDINEGVGSSMISYYHQPHFTEFNGDLYMHAYTEETGWELARLDGETGEVSIIDINEGTGSSMITPPVLPLTEFNGDAYITAYTEETGSELARIDGQTGEVSIIDINEGTGGSGPRYLTEFNGDLYMRAYTEEAGSELVRIDGETGEISVIDINVGTKQSSPADFIEFNGDLYMSAYTEETGYELFRLDGETGAVDVFDFVPGPTSGSVWPTAVVDGQLIVGANIYDKSGTYDRYGMFVAEGVPTSVSDFTQVDDETGTFDFGWTDVFVFDAA